MGRSIALVAFALIALSPLAGHAQFGPPPASPYQAPAPQNTPNSAAYNPQQLEQMLAPVALYPDHLLAQILMAATFPHEVAEAARWTRANPSLQGEHAVGAAQAMGWDSSVESLTAFPQLLAQMEQNPEWTRSLGEAFMNAEPRLMDTVQELRRRAQAAGTLRSDEQLRIEQSGHLISIEPAQPLVTYVPYYDPLVAYGAWPWAAYPPVYWRPWAGYHARPGHRMAWGPGVRHSAPARFGRFDWGQRRFDGSGSRSGFQRRADQPRPSMQQRSAPADSRRDARPRTESRTDTPNAATPRFDSPRFEGRRGFQGVPRTQAPVAAPAAAAPRAAPTESRRDAFRSQRQERRQAERPAAAAPAAAAPAAAAPAPQGREHGRGHRGDRDGRRG